MSTDCVALLDSVLEKLAAAPAAIALDVRKGERPPDEAIARTEQRIGAALPSGLAALYRTATALYWTIEDGAALGYDDGDSPAGQLELVPLDELSVEKGLVRFSNDGHGSGFCLDLRKPSKAGVPIVWWDHDSSRASTEARTFDAFFSTWSKSGFVSERSADGPLEPIIRFLRKGKLIAAKPKTAAPR